MRVPEGGLRFLTSTRGDEYQQLSCESRCNPVDSRQTFTVVVYQSVLTRLKNI